MDERGTDRISHPPAAGTRKPSFRWDTANHLAPLTLLRPLCHRSGSGAGRRDPGQGIRVGSRQAVRQRGEEPRRKCGWHLCFVLILRGRHLSARHSGPASPVEACHPRTIVLYIVSSPESNSCSQSQNGDRINPAVQAADSHRGGLSCIRFIKARKTV